MYKFTVAAIKVHVHLILQRVKLIIIYKKVTLSQELKS
jgi:hypothetical protein